MLAQTAIPVSPVVSAINPLFQPASIPKQQSGLIQKTLSNISQHLSALEDSMQQGAVVTVASNNSGNLHFVHGPLVAVLFPLINLSTLCYSER